MKRFVLLLMASMTMAFSFAQDFTWFDKPGEIIGEPSFKVFQVWSPSKALVRGLSDDRLSLYYGIVYLVVDPNGNFYDDQIIKVSREMEMRRVGTVRYTTPKETVKTVPVIQLVEKQKKQKEAAKKNKKHKNKKRNFDDL